MPYLRFPAPAGGLALLLLAAAAPLPAHAQLVTPRTVPVLQADQFDIYPSSRPGVGGVSIALDDTLADPFANPAKAVRAAGGSLFGAPFAHAISGSRGGGRTLPVGAVAAGSTWAGAGVVALQQLDRSGPTWNRPTSERTATNRYGSLAVARRLGAEWALGASAFRADLDAIDGVDLLYAGSDRIVQDGSITDLRLGLLRERPDGGSMELVLVHNRSDMTHDVHFPRMQLWDPMTGRPGPVLPDRDEHNADRTHVWGGHAEYTRPVGDRGWRVGWLATANRLSHPKIPNYVIMNIPRDPGTTYAFNAGVGAARVRGPVALGIDLVYEPMWSETWADAAADTAAAGGRVIRAGERTVENEFEFSNLKVRVGVSRDFAMRRDSSAFLGLQFGVAVNSVDYRLEQNNLVASTFRTQDEDWMEWTPTFALRYRTTDLELSYHFRVTCGTGSCDLGVGDTDAIPVAAPGAGGGVIIVAPSSPLFWDSGASVTHKFAVSIPLR